ncbi:MAG: hypothetical protein WB791_11505 [Waddliaceae bacterium]
MMQLIRSFLNFSFPSSCIVSQIDGLTEKVHSIFFDSISFGEAQKTTKKYWMQLDNRALEQLKNIDQKAKLEEIKKFFEKVRKSTFRLIKNKRRVKDLRQKIVYLQMKVWNQERGSEQLPADSHEDPHLFQNIDAFVENSCRKMFGGSEPLTLNEKTLTVWEEIYRELGGEDAQIMLNAIEEYRQARNEHPHINEETVDIREERSEEIKKALKEECKKYVPLLLGNKEVRELFKIQVIRDGLNPKIFFQNPFAAHFLRSAESLERTVTMARDSCDFDKEGDPVIKCFQENVKDQRIFSSINALEKERCPWHYQRKIRTLPGYKWHEEGGKSFRNMMGWHTLGLSKKDCAIDKGEVDPENEAGYIYTQAFGLIPFNPRTWSKPDRDGNWRAIDIKEEHFWKHLPPYKVEDIELGEKDDEGYRIEYLVSHTQKEQQLSGTHAFSCLIIPIEEPAEEDGKRRVKVGYYPFGMFAHYFQGGNRTLATMKKEYHYMDQNLQETTRGFTSWQKILSKQEFESVLKQIRKEREETINEGRGITDPSFSLATNNCAEAVRRVNVKTRGEPLPLNFPGRFLLDGTLGKIGRVVMSILSFSSLIRRQFLGWIGADKKGKKWNLTLKSPYTLRAYLQLKRETERFNAPFTGERMPLLIGRCPSYAKSRLQ